MSEPLIKLTRGVPPTEAFPTSQLSQCATAALAEHGDIVLQYGAIRGFQPLRAAIAQARGANPDQVMLGQGALSLVDLCAGVLAEPGSLIYVEEPSYDRALVVLRRRGRQVVGFPLADDGPDVASIEARLKGGERPALFYLIPDFQNPTGMVMSLEKRTRIVELAREFGFWIIEDVPYRDLRYQGAPTSTFLELGPDCTIQLYSYSKLVSPGLRVGAMIGPEDLVDRVAEHAVDTYINASYLNQAIIHEFIRRGWLEPQLARIKAMYQPRLQTMLAALDEQMGGLAEWRRPDGGFYVGMTLLADVRAGALQERARQANLVISDGRGFFAGGQGDGFVRLPFCALTREEIRGGIGRLASVAQSLR